MNALLRALCLVTILSTSIYAGGQVQSKLMSDTILHVKKVETITFRSRQFQIVGNLYVPIARQAHYPLVIWVAGSGPSVRKVDNTETVKLVNCFLDKGFACFRIDKPGSGSSKGKVDDDSVFSQLSGVVVDAVKKLKSHPLLDAKRIGLFGSSLAGYIMPIAITQCSDIAFMIGSSCPGENSIDQWKYLLERQLICSGMATFKIIEKLAMFSLLRESTKKSEFDSALAYFEANPLIVPSIGYDSSFARRARSWWPRDMNTTDEMHFNPMTLVGRIHIPLFLAYGWNDTQVDYTQAIVAYKASCAKAGNTQVKIIVLSNSDHNMRLSRGCLTDIQSLREKNEYFYDPLYFATLRGWLEELSADLKQK